jgi:hypothetical protein
MSLGALDVHTIAIYKTQLSPFTYGIFSHYGV